MMSLRLRRALLGVVLAVCAVCAVGVLAPAARADGDPGSDVLVYQSLFIAADANVSIPQQVQLGDLLSAADKAGFPIRVAIISQPDDLGAITALWRKPAAYANFLGTELSLAYAQRLLILMPNGFGFHWQGHSATAADRVLDGVRIGPGGPGLATAAETAVRTLAQASGIRLAAPVASGSAASAAAAARPARDQGSTVPGTQSGGPSAVTSAPSGSEVPLIAGIALGILIVAAAAGWLAFRAGFRPRKLPNLRLPKLPARSGRPARERRRRPFPVPGSRAGSWAWRPC
jgi:hypothetical protein